MKHYVQSFDRAAECRSFGPGVLPRKLPPPEIAGRALAGFYSVKNEKKIYFYRWEGGLHLRVDGERSTVGLEKLQPQWSLREGRVHFALRQDSREVYELSYPADRSLLEIGGDPTAFVEAEDFDLLLLVHNVLADPARTRRIFA